ncbi:O-acetyl-ADP-ribose deacetylase (regulator of RNase III) [Mycetocola sp. BIGb0189]|uniref:macro domain-containing protein n=1 Tax=Mycetocola sp. BIGb0189 TaxID=2940604 RepID=UPI00216A2A75|nr:macro domain-containing protein [Mycetocola sp. BIGb0189]MCS4275830.1 O-acetyl-ADP-ribose deacetylase (regulator of RNase III) [Mycetocola sp. BIGb0189]
MIKIRAQLGDITAVHADAIVNPTSPAMVGAGGVDAAIHRAGGPSFRANVRERFPEGMGSENAVWSIAGKLPARWVIHVTVPPFATAQKDRAYLVAGYRRIFAVADSLGVRTLSLPVIGAGASGWPLTWAVIDAIDTILALDTGVQEAILVSPDSHTIDGINGVLARRTGLSILDAVRVVHARGYHRVRVSCGMNASGSNWRVTIWDDSSGSGYIPANPDGYVLRYTDGMGPNFLDTQVPPLADPDALADRIIAALPHVRPLRDDAEYAAWFAGLQNLCRREISVPIGYADYFDDTLGWEIGWGSGVRYPLPPDPAPVADATFGSTSP